MCLLFFTVTKYFSCLVIFLSILYCYIFLLDVVRCIKYSCSVDRSTFWWRTRFYLHFSLVTKSCNLFFSLLKGDSSLPLSFNLICNRKIIKNLSFCLPVFFFQPPLFAAFPLPVDLKRNTMVKKVLPAVEKRWS